MSRIRDERTYPSWSNIRDVNQARLFNADPEKYGNNNKYEGQLKTDSDRAADNRSVLTTGVWYTNGNHYREETIKLTNKGGNGNKIDQTAYDDLFLDWRAEVDNPQKATGFTVDWDMNYTDPNIRVHKSWDKGDDTENAASPKHNMRIYGLINIDNTYPVRDAAYYRSHASALDDLKKLYPAYVTFSNNDEFAQKVAKEPTGLPLGTQAPSAKSLLTSTRRTPTLTTQAAHTPGNIATDRLSSFIKVPKKSMPLMSMNTAGTCATLCP